MYAFKENLSQIILEAKKNHLKKLEKLIPWEEIEIVKKPTVGLITVKAKDPFDIVFSLGDVLVVEAIVKYKNTYGYALILGNDEEKALIFASLEALFKENYEKNDSIKKILKNVENQIIRKKRIERALVERTRVDFEIMAKR